MKIPTLENRLDIIKYYSLLKESNIVFFYKGGMSADLFDSILCLAEEKVSHMEENLKFKRKIHVITVEILQNIYHHFEGDLRAAKHIDPLNNIIFMIGKIEDGYFIESGNFVPRKYVRILQEKINLVNGMSPMNLKSTYREVLNNGEFSDKGGAGLGILDIARKSGQKLEYDFSVQESDFTFFSLRVKIPIQNTN